MMWGVDCVDGEWLVVSVGGVERRVTRRLASLVTSVYYLRQAGLRGLYGAFLSKLPAWIRELFVSFGPPSFNYYNTFIAEHVLHELTRRTRCVVAGSGTAALAPDYETWSALQAASGDIDVAAAGITCMTRVLRWVWSNSYDTPHTLRDPRGIVADAGGRNHIVFEVDGVKAFVDVDVERMYYRPRGLGEIYVTDPVDAVRPRLPKYWRRTELYVLAQIPRFADADPGRLREAVLESAARHGWWPIIRGLAALSVAGWEPARRVLRELDTIYRAVPRVSTHLLVRALVQPLALRKAIRSLIARYMASHSV